MSSKPLHICTIGLFHLKSPFHLFTLGVRGPMGPRPPIPPDMRLLGPRDHTSPPMNLPPGIPPHPAHGDVYGQGPPDALPYSVGAPSGPRQDVLVKQEGPQDSVRPAMVEP